MHRYTDEWKQIKKYLLIVNIGSTTNVLAQIKNNVA